MKKLPILNLDQFQPAYETESFYANTFAEHLKKNHHSITIPHKHNFYVTVLFTKGSGFHEIDFTTYVIKPNSIFLLKPGQTHHWEFTEAPEGYVFFHSQSFYETTYTNRTLNHFPFFYSSQNSPCYYLETKASMFFENLFKTVFNDFSSNKLMKQQKLCSLIDLIYIELTQLTTEQNKNTMVKSKNYAIKIHELEQLIEANYITEKSPKAYAEMMNMSPKHLNRICKETLDKTTSSLITERLILEAKRLLIYSKSNFSEIAWSLGYKDYAYFSRVFKNNCGYTPSTFQKIQLKA